MGLCSLFSIVLPLMGPCSIFCTVYWSVLFILLFFQAVDKKAKMERDDAERSQRMVEEQIMRALANRKRTDEEDTPVHTELVRSEEEDKSELCQTASSTSIGYSDTHVR